MDVDSSVAARLQRRLQNAVEDFIKEETGCEPLRTLETINVDFNNYTETWSFAANKGIPLRVEIDVTVTDARS